MFCCFIEFIFAKRSKAEHFCLNHAHVAYSLNNISCTWLTLCANHGCTFCNTAQCFAKVLCSTNERHIKLVLINVINIVSWRKYFAFIDIIDFNSLKNLCFNKVSDTHFCHYWNADCFLNATYHLRIAHTRNTTCSADIGWNALQCHYCASTSSLSYACLFRSCNVHNYTAFKHLCQVAVQFCSIFFHSCYIVYYLFLFLCFSNVVAKVCFFSVFPKSPFLYSKLLPTNRKKEIKGSGA